MDRVPPVRSGWPTRWPGWRSPPRWGSRWRQQTARRRPPRQRRIVAGESIQAVGDRAGFADAVVGGADVGPCRAARDRRQSGRVGSTDPDREDVAAGALQCVRLGGHEHQHGIRRGAGGVGDTVGDDHGEIGRPGCCRGQPGAEVARAAGGEPADVAVERSSRRDRRARWRRCAGRRCRRSRRATPGRSGAAQRVNQRGEGAAHGSGVDRRRAVDDDGHRHATRRRE